MSVETSDFTSQGTAPYPALYQDSLRVSSFSEMTPDVLNDRFAEYTRFLGGDHLPKHKAAARRIIDHLAFELSYQEGLYGTDIQL